MSLPCTGIKRTGLIGPRSVSPGIVSPGSSAAISPNPAYLELSIEAALMEKRLEND